MDTKVKQNPENPTVVLVHSFDLFKQSAANPIVQVQMNVEYNPLTKEAKAVGLAFCCKITKCILIMTSLMHKDFFQGIIAQEINITDWTEVHKATMFQQMNLQERIMDNQQHNIGDETFVYGDLRLHENEQEMDKINNYHEMQNESQYNRELNRNF